MTTHERDAVPSYLTRRHGRKFGVQVGCSRKERRRDLVIVDLVGLYQLSQKLIRGLEDVLPRVFRRGCCASYATTNGQLLHRVPRHIVATQSRNKRTRILNQPLPGRFHQHSNECASHNGGIRLFPHLLHMLPRGNAETNRQWQRGMSTHPLHQ